MLKHTTTLIHLREYPVLETRLLVSITPRQARTFNYSFIVNGNENKNVFISGSVTILSLKMPLFTFYLAIMCVPLSHTIEKP